MFGIARLDFCLIETFAHFITLLHALYAFRFLFLSFAKMHTHYSETTTRTHRFFHIYTTLIILFFFSFFFHCCFFSISIVLVCGFIHSICEQAQLNSFLYYFVKQFYHNYENLRSHYLYQI